MAHGSSRVISLSMKFYTSRTTSWAANLPTKSKTNVPSALMYERATVVCHSSTFVTEITLSRMTCAGSHRGATFCAVHPCSLIVLFILCTVLELIHQQTNAPKKVQSMTHINLPHFSIAGSHPQGGFQFKELRTQ